MIRLVLQDESELFLGPCLSIWVRIHIILDGLRYSAFRLGWAGGGYERFGSVQC